MRLRTREGAAFLVLNGIQTQSDRVVNLLGEFPALQDMGVDMLRISPQANNTARIVALFRGVLAGGSMTLAMEELLALMPASACNGFWHGEPGLLQVAA